MKPEASDSRFLRHLPPGIPSLAALLRCATLCVSLCPCPIQADGSLTKMTPEDLRRVIENFSQVKRVLSAGPACLVEMLEADTARAFPRCEISPAEREALRAAGLREEAERPVMGGPFGTQSKRAQNVLRRMEVPAPMDGEGGGEEGAELGGTTNATAAAGAAGQAAVVAVGHGEAHHGARTADQQVELPADDVGTDRQGNVEGDDGEEGRGRGEGGGGGKKRNRRRRGSGGGGGSGKRQSRQQRSRGLGAAGGAGRKGKDAGRGGSAG